MPDALENPETQAGPRFEASTELKATQAVEFADEASDILSGNANLVQKIKHRHPFGRAQSVGISTACGARLPNCLF